MSSVDAFWVCFQVSELRRLCTLREVLLSVDFASERGQQVIDPLLQCFFRASHIKQEEVGEYVCGLMSLRHYFLLEFILYNCLLLIFQGKRFLAFLFSWDDNFIRMIHETIKNQLPFFPKYFMHS